MKCPNCQFLNADGMNFCGKCGTPLPLPCPRCGHENPQDFLFCGRCGDRLPQRFPPSYAERSPRDYTPPFLVKKVLNLRSSLEGERKLVTVLFADVAGFTAIAERLDPEEIHDIMDGCFEILGQEIHGAGGTINQYTGDGVMALFGAPIAYEDHVKRACHAALQIKKRMKGYTKEMQTRYDLHFQLRMGIHTGSVVVGAIGDNLRLDYTALGDTTNLAARLQALAPPGGVLVSERVWEAIHQHFKLRKVGELTVKGKEQPVPSFLLLEEQETIFLAEEAEREPLTFVNRGKELSTLKEALEAAIQNRFQLVAVKGEAGIGKSRLLVSFRDSLKHENILFLEGRCQPYGKAMAFHPFSWMFRAHFRISEHDNLEEVRHKIKKQITEKSLLTQLEDILHLFTQVRDEKEMSEFLLQDKRRSVYKALRNLLASFMVSHPLIVALDDMQWVDASTKEFLLSLFDAFTDAPFLLVCLGRSTAEPWCPGLPHHLIHLDPLPQEPASELFTSALGTDRLDPEISKAILKKAGGNPLFLVEMGETLRRQELVVCDDSKCTLRLAVEDLKVPDNIYGVLASRLDALQEEYKRMTQLASIIGKEFSHDLLMQLVDGKHDLKQELTLLEKEGVIDKISDDFGGRYIFHHRMMQEVAYHTILRRNRRHYHRLVGEAMERIYRESLPIHLGSLAYHFYHAQDWPKALAYTLEAGQQARSSFACQEALTCFDRALDILHRGQWEHIQEKALRLYKWKGGMHFCVGQMEEGRSAFEKMYAEAKRLPDYESQAEALFRIGWVSFYSHHPRVAQDHLLKAIDLSKKEGLSDILLKATSFLGFLYSVLGKLKEARPLLIQALELSGEQVSIEGRAWSLSYLIQYYNWVGKFSEALTFSEELWVLNEKLKSPYFHILLHFRKGLIYGSLGRIDEAKKILSAGLEQLQIGDDKFWRPRFLNTLGWIHAEAGDIEEAFKLNERSLEEALPTGNAETIHNAQINVGENHLVMGNLGKARDVLEGTWDKVKRPGISYVRWRYKTRLLIALGELYARLGEKKKALRFVRKSIELASRSEDRKHLAQALALKGPVLAKSRPSLSVRSMKKALALAREMGAELLAERIEHTLHQTPIERGRSM